MDGSDRINLSGLGFASLDVDGGSTESRMSMALNRFGVSQKGGSRSLMDSVMIPSFYTSQNASFVLLQARQYLCDNDRIAQKKSALKFTRPQNICSFNNPVA